ncbi:hypothetical protein [Natrialba sp. PRR66]|uniref:hypothetical protein n=1 Tax=Natrialba sp. PRR66 TaxID=3098146 RepID=UPI002B1E485E|nr:hypothetical protein [Natrialba sp. PRR66]
MGLRDDNESDTEPNENDDAHKNPGETHEHPGDAHENPDRETDHEFRTCPRCGEPITRTTVIGPTDAVAGPCGCRVAPPVPDDVAQGDRADCPERFERPERSDRADES